MTRRREPASELVITDVEQLKAFSEPFRLRIVEVMADDPIRPWTAKELAERLEVKQTKLYHHLKLLEQHGIIGVAATRMVSGIQERSYQVSARGFRVDRKLLTGAESSSAMSGALDAIFEKTRAEIMEGLASGVIDPAADDGQRRRMGLWSTHMRLSPASVRRVMRLIEKLAEVDTHPDPDGDEYGLVVGFYPRTTKDSDR